MILQKMIILAIRVKLDFLTDGANILDEDISFEYFDEIKPQ
jgi:hypothetical protein